VARRRATFAIVTNFNKAYPHNMRSQKNFFFKRARRNRNEQDEKSRLLLYLINVTQPGKRRRRVIDTLNMN
jgi:hypothetical protein